MIISKTRSAGEHSVYFLRHISMNDRDGVLGLNLKDNLHSDLDYGKHSILIMPTNIPNHWILLVLSIDTSQIVVYDLKRDNDDAHATMQKALLDFLGDNRHGKIKSEPIRNPHQTDSTSCGIFVLAFAYFFSIGSRAFKIRQCFNQTDINNTRTKIHTRC